jgi:4-hydroxybenzoate polyprenyltransferase
MGEPKLNLVNQRALIHTPNIFGLHFIQIRPKQWTKNLLVFAALLFSYEIISFQTAGKSIVGFFLFSFVLSCVYILNDFVDREAD